jgi:hypothetical protein
LNARAFDRLDSGITFDLGDEKGTSLPRQPKYDTWVLPQPAGGGGPPNQTGRLEHGELLLDAISGRTAALSVFTAPAAVTVTNERFEVRSQSGALLVAATNEADAQQRAAVLGAVAVAQGDVISLGGVL